MRLASPVRGPCAGTARTAGCGGNACSLSSRGMEPRALGDRRGASALAQLSRFGMTTPVLKNGGCGDRIMMGA
jgi:hypothetical protein